MEAMSVQAVEQKLVREIAAILCADPAVIKPDVPLPSLGLDSMGFVEILVFIEKAFGLRLTESGLNREDFQTIRALANRISASSRT